MIVSSCFCEIKACPNVFFTACFVSPIMHSQKPPYHGARLGMNSHVTFWCSNAPFKISDCNNFCIASTAARYADALSEIILHGDFQLENLLKANKNVSTVRSPKVYCSCCSACEKIGLSSLVLLP